MRPGNYGSVVNPDYVLDIYQPISHLLCKAHSAGKLSAYLRCFYLQERLESREEVSMGAAGKRTGVQLASTEVRKWPGL